LHNVQTLRSVTCPIGVLRLRSVTQFFSLTGVAMTSNRGWQEDKETTTTTTTEILAAFVIMGISGALIGALVTYLFMK
jgi:hypothetical protein